MAAAAACVAVSVFAHVPTVSAATDLAAALLSSVAVAVCGHVEPAVLAHLVARPGAVVVAVLKWQPEAALTNVKAEIVDGLADVGVVAVAAGVAERRRLQQTKTSSTKNWILS